VNNYNNNNIKNENVDIDEMEKEEKKQDELDVIDAEKRWREKNNEVVVYDGNWSRDMRVDQAGMFILGERKKYDRYFAEEDELWEKKHRPEIDWYINWRRAKGEIPLFTPGEVAKMKLEKEQQEKLVKLREAYTNLNYVPTHLTPELEKRRKLI